MQTATVVKPKLFGSLISEVINRNLCTACGGCVAACPTYILQMQNEKPTMKGKCELCQACYYSCPAAQFPLDEVEKTIFGRARNANEPIGIYATIVNARSKRDEILQRSQDGGVVTSILGCALESGKIEAAVVTSLDTQIPWKATPSVALDFPDVLDAAGTKYTPSPTLIGLMSAAQEYGKKKVAMVGTPCQIRTYRRMQTSPFGAKKLASTVSLAIGLFCTESFQHDKLVGEYLRTRNIDSSKISRFEKKDGKFRAYTGGREILNVPIKELDGYRRVNCRACEDYSAEFADISVGGEGCPEGWCTVITRTPRGQEFLASAEKNGWIELKPIGPGKGGVEKLVDLSAGKKTSVQKNEAVQT